MFDGRLICQETVVRDKHGIITSTLLYSRTRIAPLVQYTIPRLELCAAVLAIQVDVTITREISADIDIQSYVYWTDGMIVLAYLQVDAKHYHTFAGNRVARIRSHSEASQWRHVLSEPNPTDLASLLHLILQAVNGSSSFGFSHQGSPQRIFFLQFLLSTVSSSVTSGSEWFNGPNPSHSRKVNGSSCEQLVPVLESDIEVKINVISYN